MNLLVRYFNLKGFYLLLGIVTVNLLLVWLSRTLLINETVFYNAYSEQLTYDRALKLFEYMQRISWISYVLTPILLLIKYSLISLVIYTGVVFYNFQKRVTLGSVFKIVVASDIVFVLVGFVKFIWFYLFAGNYDLNDMQFFYPLSLINFFSRSEISRIWIFPMQTLNLFHVLYILVISLGLNKVYHIEKSDSDKIVILSYLPALFLWVALIMFLTIDAVS